MNPKTYLSPPSLEGNERKYLLEALDSNWIAPVGPFVDRLEGDLRTLTGLPGAVALNSGTAGIHLALRLLGVGPGDEVICPTFTFIASAAPITYLGATPVFVDCEAETWNMDPEALEQAIVSRRKAGARVKAVVFAYCYGMPGQMDAILEICNRHSLPLVEDAAEALGSTWKGKPAGTLGAIGVYSFNGNKIITGSAGGALVTADLTIAKRAKKLAAQAKEPTPHFEHHEIGYNYALSNLLAAIVVGQLEQLGKKVEARRVVFSHYLASLSTKPGIHWQKEAPEAFSNRWLSTFQFDAVSGLLASAMMQSLTDRNIESRPLWKPLHLQEAFRDQDLHFGSDLSARLFANGICLPATSVDLATDRNIA